jgi:DNA primase
MDEKAFRVYVDRMKEAVNGRSVAERLGLHGDRTRFYCPSCQRDGGKSPDLVVYDNGFKCFKCGQAGDVIDLFVLSGMSRAAAINELEAMTGMARKNGPARTSTSQTIGRPSATSKGKIQPSTPKDLAAIYSRFLDDVCRPLHGTPGEEYLAKRGIAANTAAIARVRYCHDLDGIWTLADKATVMASGLSKLYLFQKAGLPFLVFPYIKDGQPVFIKGRCLLSKDDADRQGTPRFLNTGGAIPCLWNHDAIKTAAMVLICEGEIDALTVMEVDIRDQVGVGLPGAKNFKAEWVSDFVGKDVILAMDDDKAGWEGAESIARQFVKAGLPPPRKFPLRGGLDFNEYFLEVMRGE